MKKYSVYQFKRKVGVNHSTMRKNTERNEKKYKGDSDYVFGVIYFERMERPKVLFQKTIGKN